MSLTRLAVAVALAAAVSSASGCGGAAVDPGQGALGSTVEPSPTTSALDTPTPSPTTSTLTASATATAQESPTAASGGDGGDGGDDGKAASSTAGGGVCARIGAAQVGAILGVRVTGAAVPGQTGCTFDQGGSRGSSVTILDKTSSQAGGMAGAKDEANSAVEGTPEDLTGIGSAAFVVTGSMFGGPDVNAAGATQVGSRILSVYLAQRSGLAAGKVRGLEVDLLRLVAKAKAG
jgi:hypothetical protein